MERDEVLPFHGMNQSWNPSNGADYSSHLLSATLPISIQHILKYSESIKKETSANSAASNNMSSLLNTGSELLGLKNSVGSNLISNVASMVNQHHLNHHQHHNFINGNDNNMEHHHSSSISIPNHNSMLLSHNQNGSGINMKSPTMVPIGNNITTTVSGNGKSKKERKKANKQLSTEKKPKKKKPPKERKPRPKPGEIREKTALDGTILYCCPECQMALPERDLVEQHVIQHAVERRYVLHCLNKVNYYLTHSLASDSAATSARLL
jgi:hypothetical protein